MTNKQFWVRDRWSCIPQEWICTHCGWSGFDPSTYTREDFNQTSGLVPVHPNWPTCPICEHHNFKIKDIGL